jgi:hypothetical protein
VQTHADGACLPSHGAVITQPGRGAATPVGQRSVAAIEAVQAAERLGVDTIGNPLEVDQIIAECVSRETVERLIDVSIDGRVQRLSRIGDRERFHEHIVPNICSPPYRRNRGFNTDKRCSCKVIAMFGNNTGVALVDVCGTPISVYSNTPSKASTAFELGEELIQLSWAMDCLKVLERRYARELARRFHP